MTYAPQSTNTPTAATVNDSTVWGSCLGTGAPVLQIGALSAYTDPNLVASPAETGMRLCDPKTGNIVFDTVGIAQVMKPLVQDVGTPNSTIAGVNGTSGPASQGGEVVVASGGIVLARQVTIKVEAQVAGEVTTTASPGFLQQYFYVRVSGNANTTQYGLLDSRGYLGNAVTGQVITLAAGTYTVDLIWNSANGTADTLHLFAFSLYVFQLGG